MKLASYAIDIRWNRLVT